MNSSLEAWKMLGISRALLVLLFLLATDEVFCKRAEKFPHPAHVDASSSSLNVIAYYPVWSLCDLPPQYLDWSAFSHLIFFWGEPTTSPPYFSLTAGSCDSTIFENGAVCGSRGWCPNPLDNGSNGLTHQKLMRDSAAANGVKLILCVGGEVGDPASAFADMIADSSKQDMFIDAATGFAKRHGYDGIDIDWEFPTRGPDGRAAYNRFLTRLRSVLDSWNPPGILSMAVPTWYWWDGPHTDPLIDTAILNSKVDFIDLMEYGMENRNAISHHGPLYENPDANQEAWNTRGLREWITAGADPSRCVALIPFECTKMTDVSGSAPPVAIGHSATGDQWTQLRSIPSDAAIMFDSVAMQSWAYSGTTFYSFENASTIALKVQYARDMHAGGVGIWELWQGWLPDAPAGQKDPLLKALKAAVGSITKKPPPAVKLKGQIFYDRNNNGQKDGGEPGLPGWTVRISGTSTAATKSDSSGSYTFYDLDPGPYSVRVDSTPPWVQTLPSTPHYDIDVTTTDTLPIVADFGNYYSHILPLNVSKGWGMFSLPLRVPDPHRRLVFPSSSSVPFGYSGVYFLSELLGYGKGYWIRFPYGGTIYNAGDPFSADTIDLFPGWNLIGALSFSVPSASVSNSTSPAGIISSPVWSYQRGYRLADSVRPGSAYWVQSSGTGKIYLTNSSQSLPLAGGMSGFQANSLTIVSGTGEQAEVFFSPDPANPVAGLKVPPLPPSDVFDVRFTPRGTAASLGISAREGVFPLTIQGASAPLSLKWDVIDARCFYQIETGSGSIDLTGRGEASLADAGEARVVTLRMMPRQESGIASSFELLNYPNPFNNSTEIGINLPSPGEVKLTVSDILGRQIAVLLNSVMKAGKYLVPFDGSLLASGVYLCRLDVRQAATGSSFTKVNRMIFMK